MQKNQPARPSLGQAIRRCISGDQHGWNILVVFRTHPLDDSNAILTLAQAVVANHKVRPVWPRRKLLHRLVTGSACNDVVPPARQQAGHCALDGGLVVYDDDEATGQRARRFRVSATSGPFGTAEGLRRLSAVETLQKWTESPVAKAAKAYAESPVAEAARAYAQAPTCQKLQAWMNLPNYLAQLSFGEKCAWDDGASIPLENYAPPWLGRENEPAIKRRTARLALSNASITAAGGSITLAVAIIQRLVAIAPASIRY